MDKNKGISDPEKLAKVSDYLKKTISERPYAFIMASLAQRLQIDKIDFNLRSKGLIITPPEFDLKKFEEEKCVAFMPYCCKPFDCPMNAINGRKNKSCKAIDNGNCDHPSCTIEQFVNITRKLGVDEFLIIDSDSNLFKWLAEKSAQGYKHAIGAACEFAVSYALEVIQGQFGYDGLIVMINGDKCMTREEYSEMDLEDRGRLTFIDEWTLEALQELINHQLEEESVPEPEEGESTPVERE